MNDRDLRMHEEHMMTALRVLIVRVLAGNHHGITKHGTGSKHCFVWRLLSFPVVLTRTLRHTIMDYDIFYLKDERMTRGCHP